jgi:hypothetical protein
LDDIDIPRKESAILAHAGVTMAWLWLTKVCDSDFAQQKASSCEEAFKKSCELFRLIGGDHA